MTDYYDPTGAPATNSLADSATMRAEFTAIQSGISNKLPALTGNGGEIVRINSGATAMESITVAVLAGLLASSSFAIDDATTNGVTNCLTLTHTTTGTPATGIGTGLAFVAETAAGNNETGMVLAAVTTDVTGASEDFDFSIRLMAGGAAVAEVAKFTSSGALNINTINEYTAASGVTIDGVLLKDNGITATGGGSLTGTWSNLGTVTTIDLNGGTIDGTVIGGSSAAAITGTTITASTMFSGPHNGTVGATTPAAGTFTTLNANGGGALTGTWTNLGTVTTVDINGGTIDGTTQATGTINGSLAVGGSWTAAATWTLPALTLGGTVTSNGQSFSGTIANLGSVTTVDINGGTIDGTTQATGTINGSIAVGGAWTAAATLTLPAFTLGGTVTSNGQSFSGTIANLGTVTTADINGGTIDGTVIGGSSAATGAFTTLTTTGRLGVGSTDLTAIGLHLGANISGATDSYGMVADGVIQSGVTSSARYFQSGANTAVASFTLGSLRHFTSSQATFGAGSSVTNQYGFYVESNLTGATNNFGFYGNLAEASGRYNLYMAGTASNYMAGALGIGTTTLTGYSANIAKTMTGATTAYGISNSGVIQSDVTSAAHYFRTAASTAAASFTLTTLTHYLADQSTIGASSTVTSQYGFFASSALTGATNNYGFYGSIAATANRWNLYMAGTASNYMAGNLGIGSTSLSLVNLKVAANITGGTQAYAVTAEGTIQSGVTNTAQMFSSIPSTAVAAFTLSNLYHFSASVGSFGAGSTVTSQFGFHAGAGLTGATNNYGFYSDIASGSNRWNFYANGTASNYMAGNLGIGATTLTGYNLRISRNPTGSVTSFGVRLDGTIQSDVTTRFSGVSTLMSTQATGFTLTELTHFSASQGTIGATSVVGTQIGFFAQSTLTGAGFNYGFYGAIAAASNRWNLYMTGTADNHMAGALGIGTETLTGYSLHVAKTITGATTSRGIASNGTVQSDVTSAAYYYRSDSSTQATSFTLTTLAHYIAVQGTIGAGSTVTNQYGFVVDSTLTGATNNYAFFSNIASGSNRYNFYAAGTAANLFAGDLTVYGGTSIPAGGTAGSGYKFSATANFGVFFGSGAPTLSAAKGSLYLRSDGSTTNDRSYINTDGGTTWTALTTAA